MSKSNFLDYVKPREPAHNINDPGSTDGGLCKKNGTNGNGSLRIEWMGPLSHIYSPSRNTYFRVHILGLYLGSRMTFLLTKFF